MPADIDKIRSKFERFRILVIGRANAGKTTILQKVCGTTDHPEIYDGKGHRIDAAILQASRERGYHDIENEMVFAANRGFIFHDSRGFEAGGEDEFESMKSFILKREKSKRFDERIHVIWYCLSLDEISRPISRAEEKFFGECDTRSIPVILVLTKLDAVLAIAWGQVDKSLGSKRHEAAMQLVPGIVNGAKIWDRLCKMQYPPRAEVRLQDLHKGGDCTMLLDHTSNALDDIALKQLFVSTQQVHIELCIANATQYSLLPNIRRTSNDERFTLKGLQMGVSVWFPIGILRFETWDRRWDNIRRRDRERNWEQFRFCTEFGLSSPNFFGVPIGPLLASEDSRVLTTVQDVIYAGIATIIIFDYSCYLSQHNTTSDIFLTASKVYASSKVYLKILQEIEQSTIVNDIQQISQEAQSAREKAQAAREKPFSKIKEIFSKKKNYQELLKKKEHWEVGNESLNSKIMKIILDNRLWKLPEGKKD